MTTKTLDISEARQTLANLGERLSETPVIWVQKHGNSLFAVAGKEWMEAVLETLEILEDPKLMAQLQKGLEDVRSGRVTSHEDVERMFLNGTNDVGDD